MKSAEEVLEGLRATMTLRDYFAGQALMGLIAEPVEGNNEALCLVLTQAGAGRLAGRLAVASYMLADAMIQQREKQ